MRFCWIIKIKVYVNTIGIYLLIFGGAHNLKEAKDNFTSFERKVDALITLLPTEYVIGFQDSIVKLNGASPKKYLTKFYLEDNNGKLLLRHAHTAGKRTALLSADGKRPT